MDLQFAVIYNCGRVTPLGKEMNKAGLDTDQTTESISVSRGTGALALCS